MGFEVLRKDGRLAVGICNNHQFDKVVEEGRS